MRALIICTAIVTLSGASAGEPLMRCDQQTVTYSAPSSVPIDQHIRITPVSQNSRAVLAGRDVRSITESPQQTAAFHHAYVADTMKPGPYRNSIEIYSTKGPALAWRIEIDEIRDNVQPRWLNDDLIFMQVWWGRILSTDLIFELSTGRFVYAKEAHYGMLIEPCE